jgi:DNA-directed RNA polymerase specialized sigma subunit
MIKIIFFLFLIYSFINNITYSINNNNKYSKINKLNNLKNIYSNIDTEKYLNYTIFITNNFYKKNYYHTKNIRKRDLYSYGYIGLLNSLKKYNNNINGTFYKFSKIYIEFNLLKGLSDLNPHSNLPHYLHISKKWKELNKNKYYNELNKITFYNNDYYINKHLIENNNLLYKYNDKYNDIYNLTNIYINRLPIHHKRIFNHRYYNDFQIKKSIKKISELECYSEENIRKILNKIIYNLYIYIKNESLL